MKGKLILFAIMLGFIPQISFSDNYIDRIEDQIKGEWEGQFEHLFISHPEVRVNLKLEGVNFPNQTSDRLRDENPTGTVTITTNGITETFSVSHVSIDYAYDSAGNETPQNADYSIYFKNEKKESALNFPKGIFRSTYNRVELNESGGFGSMTRK